MLLTSSEIQKKLERGAFLIHIAHKRIEALQAQIAEHEEQMHDTAQSLYDNPALVEAAIAMANMSIPALELKASKFVAENQSSKAPVSAEDALTAVLDPVTSVQSSDQDGDDLSGDDDATVVELATDGSNLVKLNTEEFFGVDVPASQVELAREIKHEAAVSVKQNTKNNTYASDRGKNAWRKALFTRARAEYLKAGVPSEVSEDVDALEADNDTVLVDESAIEAVSEPQVVMDDVVEQSVSTTSGIADATEADGKEPTDLDTASTVDDMTTEVEADDEAFAQTEIVEAEAEHIEDPDADWLPGSDVDSLAVDPNDNLETSSAGFVDIPFFDETADVVASSASVEISGELPSTDKDDHTISITETFFNDDDVPVLDPISFDEETITGSDHDDISEPEDIDVPDFDPDAELFDGDTETVAIEPQVVEAASSVAVDEASQTFNEERTAEVNQQITPEAARRAVSISSIPAHQRPGAPRPQGSIPARLQPGAASNRVVTVPGPRLTAPAQQQSVVKASPATPAPVVATPAAAAPNRAAPSRGAPSRSGEPPQRTHGYGAKVPAPPGLDEAIRERDAAEAAAKAAASSTPSSTVSAPARPSAPPARPGAPRGPAFTKPSFNR